MVLRLLPSTKVGEIKKSIWSKKMAAWLFSRNFSYVKGQCFEKSKSLSPDFLFWNPVLLRSATTLTRLYVSDIVPPPFLDLDSPVVIKCSIWDPINFSCSFVNLEHIARINFASYSYTSGSIHSYSGSIHFASYSGSINSYSLYTGQKGGDNRESELVGTNMPFNKYAIQQIKIRYTAVPVYELLHKERFNS